MIVLAVVLFVGGAVLGLLGLWTVWQDLGEIESKAKRIAGESANKVGITPEIIVGWMNELALVAALPRRKRGLALIALGLLAQTAAGVIALWAER